MAFVILTLSGGAGGILYGALALVMGSPVDVSVEERAVRARRTSFRATAGLACITLGILILFRYAGIWIGDAYAWPVALAGLGAAILWARRTDAAGRLVTGAGLSPLRIVSGGMLVFAGIAAFVAANVDLYSLPSLLLPLAAVVGGLALVVGPWLARSWSQVAEERRERIRSEERAAMAAHLHDSVLQTFALIQRSDSPSRMSSLARVQERELRSWLYGRTASLKDEHLSSAMDTLAGRIEEMHEVNVDVVTVGDAALDTDLRALVAACGEAISNAARHSGTRNVAVYIEAEPDLVTAYVRDQGKGFDLSAVPDDRRGITDSIVGRLERHGGSASITSVPGGGTEVALTLPRRSS